LRLLAGAAGRGLPQRRGLGRGGGKARRGWGLGRGRGGAGGPRDTDLEAVRISNLPADSRADGTGVQEGLGR
jgi:hypothetical protein